MPDDDPLPAVYDAPRRLAEQRLAAERPGHTVDATARVYDVYLRLAGETPDRWADTAHFFNAAAEAMRRVLVDDARAGGEGNRDGGRVLNATAIRLEQVTPESGPSCDCGSTPA